VALAASTIEVVSFVEMCYTQFSQTTEGDHEQVFRQRFWANRLLTVSNSPAAR